MANSLWRISLLLSSFLCCLPTSLIAIELTNADGSFVALKIPATSVVTLSPNLTELVFAAGGSDKLIAVVEWSDFPEAAKEIPRIGNAFRLDMEQLLKLKPDLVIAWDSGNPAEVLEKIESLGIPVWRTGISTPAQIADLLIQIGHALATEKTADLAANNFRQQLQAIQEQYQENPAFSYFIQLYSKPLYTVNGDHLITQALSLCRGNNIFAKLDVLAPAVSPESVIAASPDVIFYTQSENSESMQNNNIEHWKPWVGSGAEPRFIPLNPDWISRPGPRILKGVRQACQALAAK